MKTNMSFLSTNDVTSLIKVLHDQLNKKKKT